jgi:vancomycin permeability regulator SanA
VSRRISRKRLLAASLAVVVLAGAVLLLADRTVSRAGTGHIFTEATNLPKADLALVLGTSPRFKGKLNPESSLDPVDNGRLRAASRPSG